MVLKKGRILRVQQLPEIPHFLFVLLMNRLHCLIIHHHSFKEILKLLLFPTCFIAKQVAPSIHIHLTEKMRLPALPSPFRNTSSSPKICPTEKIPRFSFSDLYLGI